MSVLFNSPGGSTLQWGVGQDLLCLALLIIFVAFYSDSIFYTDDTELSLKTLSIFTLGKNDRDHVHC